MDSDAARVTSRLREPRRRNQGRGRTRGLFPRVLVALALIVTASVSDGYRFLFADFDATPAPRQWHPDVWGPGETLSFVLLEDEAWFGPNPSVGDFSSIAEVEQFIEDEVLTVWSNLSTADILWDIGQTSTEFVSRSSNIRVDPTATYAAAGVGTRGGQIASCNIFVSPRLASFGHRSSALKVALIHEFGHCLSLSHADSFMPEPGWIGHDIVRPSVWASDPIMSYGEKELGTITADDAIGASLLRPASGWSATAGRISGTVLMGDREGVRFVHVLATRIDGAGNMVESVGRFTNHAGEFVLDGLPPGNYLLLVRPLAQTTAHSGEIAFADRDIRDALQTSPVAVEAGKDAGPVTIWVTAK